MDRQQWPYLEAPSPEGYNLYVRLGFVLHKGVHDWYTLPCDEPPGAPSESNI